MFKIAEEVLRAALELPADERERVIDVLVDVFGVPGDNDEARQLHDKSWAKEIRRRIERLDSGEDEAIPAEDVFEELEAHLASLRRIA